MRMSRLFTRTLRETPGKSGAPGQDMLIRAGYIRQAAAGIYTMLPLAWRMQRKIEAIVREEMEAIGAEEMLMPVVNPAELWKESGRWWEIDAELSRFRDRNERELALAMTHEETVTAVMRDQIQSHRQLPALVYHIQTKWRDDPRPRAGLIRVREFTMKDSYSFDRDEEGLQRQYDAHYRAYFRIFERCGLPVTAVAADPGMMGGKVSHEYMYLDPVGEDTVISCSACNYRANRQTAKLHKQLYPEEPQKIELVETPEVSSIAALTEFLNIPARKTAKVVFAMGSFPDPEDETVTYEKLVTAVIRGDLEVEEAKLQQACEARSLRTATKEEIEACGMSAGYGSPIGAWNTVVMVDDSVAGSNNLVAGANRQGYHFLGSNFARDYMGTLADIAAARAGDPCPECGKPLEARRGIEVGNIFQLGTRYSAPMGATFQDESGRPQPLYMGSYGIGIGRLLGALAEKYHDDSGLALPPSVAPFQVHLVDLLKDDETAEALCAELEAAGLPVLLDDRRESAGVKFNDADLLGMPLRITLGKKAQQEGQVEFQLRADGSSWRVPREEAADAAVSALGEL